MSGMKKSELQTTAVIAELFDMDVRRVQQLAKSGVIPAASLRPYKFDLLPTVKTYIKYLREKANGREKKTGDVAKAESDKLQAEADIKQSKAKIAKMQLKELEGKMHRSEDVEDMTNDLVYTVRSMIMALPGRLAMDVYQAASAAEASEMIRLECHKILEELAKYKYDPEAYKGRVREREGWSETPQEDDE